MFRLPILSESERTEIHQATLRILSETGIVLTHLEAKEMLLGHGAIHKGDRILLPAGLVEKCLDQKTPPVKLIGRDPEKAIQPGDGRWYAHNVGGVPYVFDGSSNARRPATRADVAQTTRLLDSLPNVASITPLYTPQDVPSETMTLWMTYDTIQCTTKPLRAPGMQTASEVRALSEMLDIACPNCAVTVGISPISPLTFPDDIVAAIQEVARRNLILGPLPCPILGATAPMSIAGGLAQQNAEVLASIVLARLVRPGLPIIYKGRLSVMDARSGLSVWGNPEIGMVSAATVEIGHHYGIPVDVYGLSTNSHALDLQSGYERAFNALLPVLAGADEISGVGEMAGGVTSSLAQIVIDAEILASIARIQQGFEVNTDSLALDVIKTIMDDTRNFLAEDHTIKYLRDGEVLLPELAGRESWDEWQVSQRQSLVERAHAKVEQLLAQHEVPPLSDEQISALDDVIRLYNVN